MSLLKKLILTVCGVNFCFFFIVILVPEDTKLLQISTYEEHECHDSLCSELLTLSDEMLYRQCLNKQEKSKLQEVASAPLGSCKFQNGTKKEAVALVSFPGSGNTWVRGVLEQATGICTGSVYCDVNLRSAGFNGEGVQGSSVIVVKTHSYKPQWINMTAKAPNGEDPEYGSAIVLIRNPFDALVAEWNRYMAKELLQSPNSKSKNAHIKVIGKEYFGENEKWDNFIQHKIIVWQYIIYIWVVKNAGNEHPTLLVKYEDIQSDRVTVMREILDFLQMPYDPDHLERRLAINYNTFLRSRDGSLTRFEYFTASQKSHITTFIIETNAMLESHKRNVTDYIP